MASKRRKGGGSRWIATRSYSVKRNGESRGASVLVGLSAPRRLLKAEYPIRTEMPLFGCLVQTGAARTQRIVSGRDAVEALSHSLLAIDRFLSEAAKSAELRCADGSLYDPSKHGLFTGPIAEEYRKRQ
jgi:hypothetical protein